MPTTAQILGVRAALERWRAEIHATTGAAHVAWVRPPPEIPEHLTDLVEEAFKNGRAYRSLADDHLDCAARLAARPPGFWSNHETNLFYRGPGLPASEHGGPFDFACPTCHRDDAVIVRKSEWSVSLHSGDARGVFRAECSRCAEAFGGGYED